MSPCVGTLDDFRAAIRAFPVLGRPIATWSRGALTAARNSLDRHGLLLVGEMHGVAENALVIEMLATKLKIDVVALEWPAECAVGNIELLCSGPLELAAKLTEISSAELAAATAWFGDGRVTAGHFAVLGRIAAEPAAVDWVTGPSARDARDKAMAARVESLLAGGARVLFIAGNLHTRLSRHEHYAPAGMHLAPERPELCSLDIHYEGGRYWNFGSRELGSDQSPAGPHIGVAVATGAVVLGGHITAADP